jgi:hypothetical protein
MLALVAHYSGPASVDQCIPCTHLCARQTAHSDDRACMSMLRRGMSRQVVALLWSLCKHTSLPSGVAKLGG